MIPVVSKSDYVSGWAKDAGPGTVHSTFGSSLNLEFAGRLVHVGPSDAPLSCFGLTVSPEAMGHLLGVVRTGDRVVSREGAIRIYSVAGVSELDLADAVVRPLAVRGVLRELREGLDLEVGRALRGIDLTARIGLPWPDRSQAMLAELARFSAVCLSVESDGWGPAAQERFEAARHGMLRAVTYLLGRGLGLTPSGDDVLMGFGTGLRFLHGGDPQLPAASFFRAVEREVPGKTTAVSEAYLRAMCKGYANEDYIDLLDALERGERAGIDRAAAGILSVGHTSGADSLLGFGASFCCLM